MKFRNVSGQTLYVPALRFPRVEHGEIADFPDDYCATHYIQTGDQNEPPLWEAVVPLASTKKSARAEKE